MSELNKYPKINNEVIKEHGLSQDEYDKIKDILSREIENYKGIILGLSTRKQ